MKIFDFVSRLGNSLSSALGTTYSSTVGVLFREKATDLFTEEETSDLPKAQVYRQAVFFENLPLTRERYQSVLKKTPSHSTKIKTLSCTKASTKPSIKTLCKPTAISQPLPKQRHRPTLQTSTRKLSPMRPNSSWLLQTRMQRAQ